MKVKIYSMRPTTEMLERACMLVRQAAQQISDENRIPYFSPFPLGWCGCTSRVLGAWLLHLLPNNLFYYMCGQRGSHSHAWVEYNGLILDITADQFEDYNENRLVIPKEESDFHKQFRYENKHLCDVADVDYVEEGLIFERVKFLDNYQQMK